MPIAASHEVTQLLLAWNDGDQTALDRLIPPVHAELRRIARRYMRNERAGHTLQTSALINEAYLRLIDAQQVRWQNCAGRSRTARSHRPIRFSHTATMPPAVTRLPETASASTTLHADLEIQFAGQTAHYKQVPLERADQGNQIRISGTIPMTLPDFKIDPPSLLTLPVKYHIPVRVGDDVAPAVNCWVSTR